MARQKGKSGSTKPLSSKPPSWVTHGSKETIILVKKLAKQGYSPSKIGLILRDNYGIPSVKDATGKKIGYFLKKNKLQSELPEDLGNLIKKADNLKEHMAKNKKDIHNKRNLRLIESKIHRLSKHYKREGELPPKWKYQK